MSKNYGRAEIFDALTGAADLLQQSRALDVIGAKEVLSWVVPPGKYLQNLGIFPGPRIGFRGNDLRIEKRFLESEIVLRDGEYWSERICKDLGLRPFQLFPDGAVAGLEFLYGIQIAVERWLELRRDVEVEVRVTIIPHQGTPWIPARRGEGVTEYYNARLGKIQRTGRPDWLKPVVGGRLAADFCKVVGTITTDPPRPAAVHFYRIGRRVYLTHSFNIERYPQRWKAIARHINHCGGILFPSLALAEIPASIFGPASFVVDPRVALSAIRPFRQSRGRWDVVIYAGDAWTESASQFQGIEMLLFEQLIGEWSPGYGHSHLYTLGPVVRSSSPYGNLTVVKDQKNLERIIERKARFWTPDQEELDRYFEDTTMKYPFLEVKTNSVLSVDALVACVAPASKMRSVRPLLREIGFSGAEIPVKTPKSLLDGVMRGRDAETYEYAWLVRDALDDFTAAEELVLHI